MQNNTFVSSQFETWNECKSKYHLKYIKKLRLPEKQNDFELGRNVHALVNYHLRGFDISLFEKQLDEKTAKHWNAIKNHKMLSHKYICSEWEFNARIADSKYWLNGRIDAVFYDRKNNKYIITDWKTGQNVPKNPEDSFQAKIYLYALYRAQQDMGTSFKQADLEFQHIKTPDDEYVPSISYSTEKETIYESNLLKIVEEITNYDFRNLKANPGEQKCRFCPYKGLCNTLS